MYRFGRSDRDNGTASRHFDNGTVSRHGDNSPDRNTGSACGYGDNSPDRDVNAGYRWNWRFG